MLWNLGTGGIMNLSYGKGAISMGSCSGSWRAGEVSSDQFPAGLRVLIVDDDPTCLRVLERMLQACLYEVTKCYRAEEALSLLRGNKNGFDIVLSDVHMPDMDGFKLLEHIGLEMDLPVIMMSMDDEKNVVMKGITHGACDYLIKPIRIEALRNIWQHVVRKRKTEWKELEQSGSVDDEDRLQRPSEEADNSSSANEGNWRSVKRRKDEEEEEETDERDDSSTLKKARVVWSVELHQQFVAAVNQLGIEKAVPKKILDLMNVPGLTRENVASHLQKYRLYLRRLNGASQHQNNVNNSFINSPEANFGPISSLNGIDLRTLVRAGQLPQSLVTSQAAGVDRSTAKSSMPLPLVDQRSLFSFENPKLRFTEGQQQHLHDSKPMNLLHVQSSARPMQLAQSRGRVHIRPNEINGSNVPTAGQSLISNGPLGGVFARNNLVIQTSSTLNFPLNQTAELPGNSFPLQCISGISSLPSTGKIPEAFNQDVKGSGGFEPSYDILNELHQKKSHDWDLLQNAGLTFDDYHHVSSLKDTSIAVTAMSSLGEDGQYSNQQIMVKAERFREESSGNGVCSDQFGQEDLMSVLLGQHQNIGITESKWEFDGYGMDNIPI